MHYQILFYNCETFKWTVFLSASALTYSSIYFAFVWKLATIFQFSETILSRSLKSDICSVPLSASSEPLSNRRWLLKPFTNTISSPYYCLLHFHNTLDSIHKLPIRILTIAEECNKCTPSVASVTKSSSKGILNQQLLHQHHVHSIILVIEEWMIHLWPRNLYNCMRNGNPFEANHLGVRYIKVHEYVNGEKKLVSQCINQLFF